MEHWFKIFAFRLDWELPQTKTDTFLVCKVFLAASLFFLFSGSVQGQNAFRSEFWPKPFRNILSIHFWNANHGWAAGENSLILHTTNGGKDWQEQKIIPKEKLHTVLALDSNVCLLVSHARIYRTLDAGKSWHEVYKSFSRNLKTMKMLEDGFLYTLSKANTLLKSTDRGNSWQEEELQNVQDQNGKALVFQDIHFFDQNQAYAKVAHPYNGFVRTKDGGKNWKFFTVKGLEEKTVSWEKDYTRDIIGQIEFLAPSEGCYFNPQNLDSVAITNNWGKTWKWINTLKGRTDKNSRIFNWLEQKKGGLIQRRAIKIFDNQGNLIHDQPLEWRSGSDNRFIFYFLNAQTGWMASEKERLFARTLDGGKTWQNMVDRIPMSHIRDVVVPGKGKIVLSGGIDPNRDWDKRQIHEPCLAISENNGKTWQTPFLLGEMVTSIFFIGEIGWLTSEVSSSNSTMFVYKTTNGGASWSLISNMEKPEKQNQYVYDSHGSYYPKSQYSSAKSIFFCDNKYGMVQTDLTYALTRDGGFIWKPFNQNLPKHAMMGEILIKPGNTINDMGEVAMPKAKTLVKANRTISISHDTGKTWKQVSGKKGNFRHLFFLDSLHGWSWEEPDYKNFERSNSFDSTQILAQTLDGGNTWKEYILDINSCFKLIKFINTKEGWALPGPLYTQDGGKTWVPDNLLMDDVIFTCLKAINQNEVWFGTNQGFLKKLRR